ncbi:glutaredoxin family protein [Gammaproteobacteria bacterium AB-CW1]|uniref:Glutaredoxin family protein n=1 Tax=Natronospira elongata TaxID=3110268 RepID=A0AAP6JFP2_9GAMM|nr:glutaredoxin family protein [Gammaproteobacteria bacterium AB-CW1]
MEIVVYSRPGCGLCDQMLVDLQLELGSVDPIRVVDIRENEALKARYGLRIPVLEIDGETLCEGRLDLSRLRAALAAGDK